MWKKLFFKKQLNNGFPSQEYLERPRRTFQRICEKESTDLEFTLIAFCKKNFLNAIFKFLIEKFGRNKQCNMN